MLPPASCISTSVINRYGRYKCEKGTTAVLTENVALLELEVVDETVQTMDTS